MRIAPGTWLLGLVALAVAGCADREVGSINLTASKAAAGVSNAPPASPAKARRSLDGPGLARPRGGLSVGPGEPNRD